MAHYDRWRIDNMRVPCTNMQDSLAEPPRKHTEGKAQGARHFYVHALYYFCNEVALQKFVLCLDLLASGKEPCIKGVVNNIQACFKDPQELWNGVINVRRKAIESGKYTIEGYKQPIDKHLLVDAMIRHLIAYIFIDTIDKESGENHLCHIAANLIMYSFQINHHRN